MREQRIETDGIPARLYDPGGAEGLLLLGHGGGYGKDSERFVRLAREYAEQTGLAVVCIDAVNHGERKSDGVSGGVPQRWHSDTVEQMIADWLKTVHALQPIGTPIAYVGFSMGMIFGAPTVAALPSIKVTVFGAGGIPYGGGIDDPPLRDVLLDAASKLGNCQLLMLNMTQDEIFPSEGVHEFFDAVPGRNKRLMFWEASHDDWPAEAIRHSVAVVNEYSEV